MRVFAWEAVWGEENNYRYINEERMAHGQQMQPL